MSKIVFECVMSENPRVYRSGDLVSGTILVEFTEPVKIRGIDIQFLGHSVVNWSESKRAANDTRRLVTKHYANRETYFDATLLLFGRAASDDGDVMEHPVGTQKYPFQFKLPPKIPATFESVHGSVCYAIIGLIDIPWAQDKTFKQKLMVECDLNLNDIEQAKDSLIGHDEKMLCCGCCKHGPIVAEFNLPQAGWAPGECIPISASITNHSRRKVLRTEVKLNQKISYQSSGKRTKTIINEIMSIMDDEDILKGAIFEWKNEPMVLPPLPPTFLPYCGIIEIRYEMVFNLDVAGTPIDMAMPVEVIVGTIPLKESRGIPPPEEAKPPRVGSHMVTHRMVNSRNQKSRAQRKESSASVSAPAPAHAPAPDGVVTSQPEAREEQAPFEKEKAMTLVQTIESPWSSDIESSASTTMSLAEFSSELDSAALPQTIT